MGTFLELFDRLDPDPRVRGKQFEHVCKWFLTNDPTYKSTLRRVWLWDEWSGRWGGDAGIDVVAEDHEGRLWAIQAKAYSPENAVTKADVDKFLSESSRSMFSYRLLIATTDKLHHVARRTINDQEKQVAFLGLSDLLTSEVNWRANPLDMRQSPPPKPAKPREHQRKAIREVEKWFTTSNRGQLIMACGTGKTLTSLFIKEKLAAQRTLVLVPSLSLLKQTMQEWTVNRRVPFESRPVCSDETVGRSDEDAAVAHTSELGLPVTTDPHDIAAFLRRRSGSRVVFSTYQSSPQVAAAFALGRVPAFDLVIADEAHRVATVESSAFGTVLDETAIKARRRLFMTATPRYFTGRVLKAAQEADLEVASMDDEAKFGKVFHRLTFGEAIKRQLLTDYQVVVVGVDNDTYLQWAQKGTLITRDGEKVTDARTLAGQVGLAKAMREYNLQRTISFHSRVARARAFANEMPEVIAWMPTRQRPKGALWSRHASGEMSAGKRHVLLQHLSRLDDGERGLLTNARCLSEGIDVPTLDGVAFVDPRRSEVDIVQAVGRAIRKSEGKIVGTIVIPVFIEADANPQTALDDSSFKPVWDVIQALRAHDGDLGEQIDALRREMGRTGGVPKLPDKIHLDLPLKVGADFADALNVRLLEKTTSSWEFSFGTLERFVEHHGHARVAQSHKEDGYQLGWWVVAQRAKYDKGTLDADHQHRLMVLPGWTWDPRADQWEEGFGRLVDYAERHGHSRVPRSCIADGYRLGAWINMQRNNQSNGTLDADRRRRLQQLPGWSWDARTDQWDEGFGRLVDYAERHGHSRVPVSYTVDGFRLGAWVNVQRDKHSRGTLETDRQSRLQALSGWLWNPLDAQWEKGFGRLLIFVDAHGHARVPQLHEVDGYNLGNWVGIQRGRYAKGTLDPERRQRLETLTAWTWSAIDYDGAWEEGLSRLRAYVERHGDSLVPQSCVVEGYKLGSWVTVQRHKHTKATLDHERERRLDKLSGWVWDARTAQWEAGIHRLQQYVELHGNALVPQGHTIDGFKLGTWVNTQRNFRSAGRLEPERERRLEAEPGWTWDSRRTKWEEGFRHLQEYVEQNGDARVAQSYVIDGFRLGNWVNMQRTNFANGALDGGRRNSLQTLPGWTWAVGRQR